MINEKHVIARELGADWIATANDVWSELLQRSHVNSIFMSWEWISSWMETLGLEKDVRILGLFEDNKLVGVAPFLLSRSLKVMWGRSISLFGVDETGADYNDIVCARGSEDKVAQAVADWLIARGDWVRCEFRDILPTALIRRVAELMATDSKVEDIAGSVCPRTYLANGWQGILRERFDRKRRYNIERQMRIAVDRDGHRFVIYDTPESISEAFPVLVKLHNERKNAVSVKSAFSKLDRLNFHFHTASKLAGQRKGAFIATLESRQEILSAAYCFRDRSCLYYFQTGMSSAGSELGSGSTLLYMLLRWAADQGYEWFDFLKGDEDYKNAWTTDRVEQRIVTVTRTTVRGRAGLAMAGMRRALILLLKKSGVK